MKKLIISAVGQDQAGIVAAFTKVLFEMGCNVEDTSMTLLEDHFTMLFIVHAPLTTTETDLEDRLKSTLKDFHLQVAIHTIDTNKETPDSTGRPWMVSVSGKDQTGIIFHVTQYLAGKGINIRHLSSKMLTRPHTDTLFLMALECDIPESVTDDMLQNDLHQVALEENLEIVAEPLEVYTL